MDAATLNLPHKPPRGLFDLCIYDGADLDGKGSAACVLEHSPEAELVALRRGPIKDLEIFRGRTVVFVDCQPMAEDLPGLLEVAQAVFVYDHHPETRALIDRYRGSSVDSLHISFDRARCAALIAFDDLIATGPGKPSGLKLIDLYDRGEVFQPGRADEEHLQRAYHFYVGLDELGLKPEELRVELLESREVEAHVERGRLVARVQDRIVSSMIENPRQEAIAGTWVPSIPCPAPMLINIAATRLLAAEPEAPFVALWRDRYSQSQGCWVRSYSLRSAEGRGVDLGEVARKYGGGGHPMAAGFRRRID